jgi:hypothetical protein
MEIRCPSCGDVVEAKDISLERMLAKCLRCNDVFDVSAQVGRPAGSLAHPVRARALVTMPRSLRVLEGGAGAEQAEFTTYREMRPAIPRLVIERRWFTPAAIALAFFCLFWDGFLVFWYSVALSSSKHPPTMAILFPFLHVAAGVAITYAALCAFVNRSRIAVDGGRLRVTHGPLPWFGQRDLPVGDIRQLYCEQRRGQKGSTTYRLKAIMGSGDRVTLLRDLRDPQPALYLEALLERHLGIVDEPVAGEFV